VGDVSNRIESLDVALMWRSVSTMDEDPLVVVTVWVGVSIGGVAGELRCAGEGEVGVAWPAEGPPRPPPSTANQTRALGRCSAARLVPLRLDTRPSLIARRCFNQQL
jgi:hypothetical protein